MAPESDETHATGVSQNFFRSLNKDRATSPGHFGCKHWPGHRRLIFRRGQGHRAEVAVQMVVVRSQSKVDAGSGTEA